MAVTGIPVLSGPDPGRFPGPATRLGIANGEIQAGQEARWPDPVHAAAGTGGIAELEAT